MPPRVWIINNVLYVGGVEILSLQNNGLKEQKIVNR